MSFIDCDTNESSRALLIAKAISYFEQSKHEIALHGTGHV